MITVAGETDANLASRQIKSRTLRPAFDIIGWWAVQGSNL